MSKVKQKRRGRVAPERQRPLEPGLRQSMYDIIFGAESYWGRMFDIILLLAIVGSIAVVAFETLPTVRDDEAQVAMYLRFEIGFAILFGIEYVLRLYCTRRPLRYVFSFWGVIDLLSFLPSLLVGLGAMRQNAFVILRSVRLLRVFRIMKLWRLMSEADVLGEVIWRSRGKIIVFLSVVMVAVTISGALMYQVENSPYQKTHPDAVVDSKFDSIPQSMYWAIVTMTTVGYGDIVPETTVGKIISAALILLGYSLIIVPTGFVSAEFNETRKQIEMSAERSDASSASRGDIGDKVCPACEETMQLKRAIFCHRCGTRLPRD